MNGLPYYKAYPRDFIEGTIGMSLELKGAYRVLLDLIYMQGGKLPDDARYISGLLGCSLRKWKSIRQELLASGKVYVSGAFLSNYRAEKELETLAKLQDIKRENRAGYNKNKDLQKRPFDHTEPEPYREDDLSSSMQQPDLLGQPRDAKSVSKTKPRRRIPDDWMPDLDDRNHAKRIGLSDADIERESSNFRDHHLASGKPGADWSAAWRKWCRNHIEWGRGGNRQGVQPRPAQSGHDTFRAAMAAEVARRSGGQLQPAGDSRGHRTIEGTAERVGEPDW